MPSCREEITQKFFICSRCLDKLSWPFPQSRQLAGETRSAWPGEYTVYLPAVIKQTANPIPESKPWRQSNFVEGVSPMFDQRDITISVASGILICHESFCFYQWQSWIGVCWIHFIFLQITVYFLIGFSKIIRLGWTFTFFECSGSSEGRARKDSVWDVCDIFTDAAGPCHPLKGEMRKGEERLWMSSR